MFRDILAGEKQKNLIIIMAQADALDLLAKVERQQHACEFAKTIKLRSQILATVTALSARPSASAARTALQLYDMLGSSYEQLKLYSEAQHVHSEQLSLAKSSGDLLGQCWAMKWLASSHSWLHQHETALSLFAERAQLLQATVTAMPFTCVKDEIPAALAEVDYWKAVHQREQGRIEFQEMHAADPRSQPAAGVSPAGGVAPGEPEANVGAAGAGLVLSEESLEDLVQKKQSLLKVRSSRVPVPRV